MVTWRQLVQDEMGTFGDSWENLESITLSDTDLDQEFDAGFGAIEGKPFTLWTKTRVYFPLTYDGSEWVGSLSRYPDGNPTYHLGGG